MRPSDFTIGSVESRAAAREVLRRRISHDFSDATVVIFTGLPSPRGTDSAPVAILPDFIEYRVASDGSVVQAIHRYWEGDGKSGLTIFIDQMWPDGSLYNDRKESYIESVSDFKRLPLATPEQIRYLRGKDANA